MTIIREKIMAYKYNPGITIGVSRALNAAADIAEAEALLKEKTK